MPTADERAYFGADDYEGSNPIGYDEDDSGWEDEDAFLRGVDDELDAIEGEDDDDVVGDDEEIGGEEIGRRMGRRARRMQRLEETEGKVRDRMKRHKNRPKRKKRLAKRLDRIDRTQDKLLDRQQRAANRKAGRGGKRSKQAAALAAGGAAAGAGAGYALSRRGGRGTGDDAMQDVFLDLPPEGRLVRLPLLKGGKPYADLSLAALAAAGETTAEMATAGVTYAKLKVRGFIIRFNAKCDPNELLAHTLARNGKVDGGIDLFYGDQLGVIQLRTTTTGDGVIFVPCVRDDSVIYRNAVVKCTVGINTLIALVAAAKIFAQAEVICERLDDPAAEHMP
jgi:hypothetical protein